MSSNENKMPAILYADNEEQNLVSFKAIFRRDFKIFSTTSPAEALSILEKEQVGIIICSKFIGQMKGVDFLASTITQHGNRIRLLVSDYAYQDTKMKAAIFGYLIKPWDEDQIKRVLDDAFHYFISKKASDNIGSI